LETSGPAGLRGPCCDFLAVTRKAFGTAQHEPFGSPVDDKNRIDRRGRRSHTEQIFEADPGHTGPRDWGKPSGFLFAEESLERRGRPRGAAPTPVAHWHEWIACRVGPRESQRGRKNGRYGQEAWEAWEREVLESAELALGDPKPFLVI